MLYAVFIHCWPFLLFLLLLYCALRCHLSYNLYKRITNTLLRYICVFTRSVFRPNVTFAVEGGGKYQTSICEALQNLPYLIEMLIFVKQVK